MRMTTGLRSLVCAGAILALTTSAHARSLVSRIDSLFGEGGSIDLATSSNHRAHFNSQSASALGSLVGQLAGNAADFTALSTTPGFTYRLNPDLDIFERTPGSMGSVFVDVPQTVGKGGFAIGASYLFVDFAELDGKDLDGLTLKLKHQDLGNNGRTGFEDDTIDLTFDKFSLQSHVISTFSTYGITDRWDVNVLVPVVLTSLDVRGRAVINDVSGLDVHHFSDGGIVQSERTESDKIGLGDVLLRTKYRFTDNPGFNVGSGLVLRLPTGDKNDFQGFGDTTLTPFLVMAQSFGPHNLHLNTGIEIDTQSLSRSRARYAAGVSVQLIEGLAFLVDVIGSSGLTNETVEITVPVFDSTTGETLVDTRKEESKFRTDIVDLAVGFKLNPVGTVVAFAGAIVPLNEDGLRPDVVPTGGIEVSF